MGKSNLVLRFSNGQFNPLLRSTIGFPNFLVVSHIDLCPDAVAMQIWDSPGDENFRVLTHAKLPSAECVIIAFSIDDRRSYRGVKSWIEAVEKKAPEGVVCAIVGTKCDAKERV